MTATVTYDDLVKNDACEERETFRGVFGNKTEITVALAKKHAMEFDWGWAAGKLLPEKLYEQWQRQTDSFHTRYRADLELADYNLRFTPTGVRRAEPTEKQKAAHRKIVNTLQRKIREQQAAAFAKLFIGKSRYKRQKSDLLLEQLRPRLEDIIRELIEQNEKDQFMESEDYGDSVRSVFNDLRYRVHEIRSEVRSKIARERRAKRQEERRARQQVQRVQHPEDLALSRIPFDDDLARAEFEPF